MLVVPASHVTKVIYRNLEVGAEHNVAVYRRQDGELIAGSGNIVGPDVTELVLPPLAPGTYFVQCDTIHS